MKLLDLSGYEISEAEGSGPVYSQYGNWVLASVKKDGKDKIVLGMRNGAAREFDGTVAVSPNFKQIAYEVKDSSGSKVVIESIENKQKDWESPVFEKIYNSKKYDISISIGRGSNSIIS